MTEKEKMQKEVYLKLRNELLEKGFTESEVAEYIYYKGSAEFGDICSLSLTATAMTAGLLTRFSGIANSNEILMYISNLVVCGSLIKLLADILYFDECRPAVKLMNNLTKKVEMREVKRETMNETFQNLDSREYYMFEEEKEEKENTR